MSTLKNFPCKFTDCPAHPEYNIVKNNADKYLTNIFREAIQKPSNYSERTYTNSCKSPSEMTDVISEMITSNHISSYQRHSRLATENIEISFECLMCVHLEKIDMREKLIINEAKKKLSE